MIPTMSPNPGISSSIGRSRVATRRQSLSQRCLLQVRSHLLLITLSLASVFSRRSSAATATAALAATTAVTARFLDGGGHGRTLFSMSTVMSLVPSSLELVVHWNVTESFDSPLVRLTVVSSCWLLVKSVSVSVTVWLPATLQLLMLGVTVTTTGGQLIYSYKMRC